MWDSIGFVFWRGNEQAKPLDEDLVPLLSQQPVSFQLILRAVVQENRTVKLSVVVSAELEPIGGDDFPTEVTCSRSTSTSNGEIINGTGYPGK